MTLGFDPYVVVAAAIADGSVTREQEVAAVLSADSPSGGGVDWRHVQHLLGLPNPVTHWNKFGG